MTVIGVERGPIEGKKGAVLEATETFDSVSPSDFDISEGSLVMLAEANYFLNLPALPITPYAGLHVGLGTYSLDDVDAGVSPEPDVVVVPAVGAPNGAKEARLREWLTRRVDRGDHAHMTARAW